MATASCADFLQGFVLPLVAGGDMHVGRPIDASTLERYEQELPHASVPLVAIDDAREQVLATLVVNPPAFVLDVDELSLAAAVHNLLFLAHPDADGWNISDSKRTRVVASAQSFAARPRSMKRTRILARHGLLHNLFRIGRTDTRVSWWTGSATYFGQEVPARLTRWSDVRRVHREQSTVGFRELFQGADVVAVIAALARRSPLTLLLSSGLGGPHLHWEDSVALLRDAEIARALAYSCIEGASVAEQVRGPARFAASFEQMLERAPREADVRTVLAFLVYLNGLLAIRERGIKGDSPLMAAALGAAQRPRGLATFFAAPAAAQIVDARLSEPPGLSADPVLSARYRAHRSQALSLLGESVIEGVAERLERHLQGAPHSALARKFRIRKIAMLKSAKSQEDGSSSSES